MRGTAAANCTLSGCGEIIGCKTISRAAFYSPRLRGGVQRSQFGGGLLFIRVSDGLLRLGGLFVFLRKTLDAARRIQQLLLSGKERVAVRTNFDAQQLAPDR